MCAYTVLHNLSGWKPCKSFFGDYTENMKKIVGTIWDLSANPNITANPAHFHPKWAGDIWQATLEQLL